MGRFEMKLIGAVLVALASADQLTRLTTNLATKWREVETMKQVTITDEDLNSALQKDTMSHTRVKGVRGIKLMPDAGSCGLHWDLYPNMCNLNETLENYFQEIVGNKMTKYQEWRLRHKPSNNEFLKTSKENWTRFPSLRISYDVADSTLKKDKKFSSQPSATTSDRLSLSRSGLRKSRATLTTSDAS